MNLIEAFNNELSSARDQIPQDIYTMALENILSFHHHHRQPSRKEPFPPVPRQGGPRPPTELKEQDHRHAPRTRPSGETNFIT